ncbi:MAG: TonB family protein [Nitrospiraceae bacterium]|uniref:TonB family protein n=1 Tax=Nitrospira cf. moscoviensis SBR1015 TaxID=96242 RepID=UPI0011210539|nr:TonB family protein [Nitrospira cf. moscoviensis SBR1015]MBY0248263.1 TonB family protein [Nitrospiraceae bacterium]
MNGDLTISDTRLHLLHGWGISLVFHGLLLSASLSLLRQSPITIATEPFYWNVVLVPSTYTADKPVQSVDATTSAAPKQPNRIATASHTNHTIRQAAPSASRSASLDTKPEAPVPPTSIRDSPSSVLPPKEAASTSMSSELPSPLAQSTQLAPEQSDAAIGPTAKAPPHLETAAALEEGTQPIDATQPSPLSATASDTLPASTIQPDYGWLQQAIFRRLEELKRSSRPSLNDSRPLKVTVKAVVSREGILLDSAVVKSSGLDHIDQAAMALVQKAFPLPLDHPLDRQQVAMRIPITYSRE